MSEPKRGHHCLFFIPFGVLMMSTAFANHVIAASAVPEGAIEVGVEVGPLWSSRNDVRVPGTTGTEFDMTSLTGDGPDPAFRLDVDWQITDKHGVRAVIAPLELTGSGQLPTETFFAGTTLNQGSTNATYRFNTYKLTYRYTLSNNDVWRWNIGFTGVIRDADIALQQGQTRANDDDVGFVPTLHLSGIYQPRHDWRLLLDFDGLAGGPGRLFDIALKADYSLNERWRIGAGYRMLEGGVDVDDVYNFGWFNALTFDLRYSL
jgi:hypothetical protein